LLRDDAVAEVATAIGFAEGPVHRRDGSIAFTSIDKGHVYAVDAEGCRLLLAVGGQPNGAAEGADGSLFLAMAGGIFPGRPFTAQPSGVAVIRPSGRLEWLTTDPVAPNDLCFGPDGHLYVTDPTRGTTSDGRVWRIDPETGLGAVLASVPWYPNGIGFSHRDDHLYVADTANSRIIRWELEIESGVGEETTVVTMDHGRPDGFAFDVEGNLILAAPARPDAGKPSDVQVWSPEGELLESFAPGERVCYTNVALSAEGALVLTDGGSLAAATAGLDTGGCVLLIPDWPTVGLPLHPFRGDRAPARSKEQK
jgi:gluconolactonase